LFFFLQSGSSLLCGFADLAQLWAAPWPALFEVGRLLFGLGLGGSPLAGFGMAAVAAHSRMVIFAATLMVTLYTVTDMECPRLGLIRIENFDHFLVEAYEQMR
jgi:hypothetical protein